ncbi:MAG: sialidase family protein [Victivallaceae bacterium]|nr:sialidase family protein [Victivallaceae bacterium]
MAVNFYTPEITHSPVYFPRNGSKPFLRYNHCADSVFFRGQFYTLWNANAVGTENHPGQYIFLATSEDFRNWSAPRRFCEEALDNQWQPALLVVEDTLLICAWCDFNARKTFISSTTDGKNWVHQPVELVPEELQGKVVVFPTGHGTQLADGRIVFPVNYPEITPPGGVGSSRYAGIIYRDAKGLWHASGLTEAARYGDGISVLEKQTMPRPQIWEPSVWERAPGKLSMLVRNSGEWDNPMAIPPDETILYAESSDNGATWSECRPSGIPSVVSRNFTARSGKGMLMVMNDWLTASSPGRGPDDRLELTLFVAPEPECAELMPGPRVQFEGGRAFYPGGFVNDQKLYLVYTYPDYIMSTQVDPLPDFDRPFLMRRDSRDGTQIDRKQQILSLNRPEAAVFAVASTSMMQQDALCWKFRFRTCFRSEREFTIFSVGNAAILLQYDDETQTDRLILRRSGCPDFLLKGLPFSRATHFVSVTAKSDCFEIVFDERSFPFPGRLERKAVFGQFHCVPVWPLKFEPVRDRIEIFLDSIVIE